MSSKYCNQSSDCSCLHGGTTKRYSTSRADGRSNLKLCTLMYRTTDLQRHSVSHVHPFALSHTHSVTATATATKTDLPNARPKSPRTLHPCGRTECNLLCTHGQHAFRDRPVCCYTLL